jgi:hypothetical protein
MDNAVDSVLEQRAAAWRADEVRLRHGTEPEPMKAPPTRRGALAEARDDVVSSSSRTFYVTDAAPRLFVVGAGGADAAGAVVCAVAQRDGACCLVPLASTNTLGLLLADAATRAVPTRPYASLVSRASPRHPPLASSLASSLGVDVAAVLVEPPPAFADILRSAPVARNGLLGVDVGGGHTLLWEDAAPLLGGERMWRSLAAWGLPAWIRAEEPPVLPRSLCPAPDAAAPRGAFGVPGGVEQQRSAAPPALYAVYACQQDALEAAAVGTLSSPTSAERPPAVTDTLTETESDPDGADDSPPRGRGRTRLASPRDGGGRATVEQPASPAAPAAASRALAILRFPRGATPSAAAAVPLSALLAATLAPSTPSGYRCDACGAVGRCEQRYVALAAPDDSLLLAIGRCGYADARRVELPATLRPPTVGAPAAADFTLAAVVVRMGASAGSLHYATVVPEPGGADRVAVFSDSEVVRGVPRAAVRDAVAARAYMALYTRTPPAHPLPPSGVRNMGNTCYMGALLVLLQRDPAFLARLRRVRREVVAATAPVLATPLADATAAALEEMGSAGVVVADGVGCAQAWLAAALQEAGMLKLGDADDAHQLAVRLLDALREEAWAATRTGFQPSTFAEKRRRLLVDFMPHGFRVAAATEVTCACGAHPAAPPVSVVGRDDGVVLVLRFPAAEAQVPSTQGAAMAALRGLPGVPAAARLVSDEELLMVARAAVVQAGSSRLHAAVAAVDAAAAASPPSRSVERERSPSPSADEPPPVEAAASAASVPELDELDACVATCAAEEAAPTVVTAAASSPASALEADDPAPPSPPGVLYTPVVSLLVPAADGGDLRARLFSSGDARRGDPSGTKRAALQFVAAHAPSMARLGEAAAALISRLCAAANDDVESQVKLRNVRGEPPNAKKNNNSRGIFKALRTAMERGGPYAGGAWSGSGPVHVALVHPGFQYVGAVPFTLFLFVGTAPPPPPPLSAPKARGRKRKSPPAAGNEAAAPAAVGDDQAAEARAFAALDALLAGAPVADARAEMARAILAAPRSERVRRAAAAMRGMAATDDV